MSWKALHWATEFRGTNGTQKLVLMLMGKAVDDGAIFHGSQGTLATQGTISVRAVGAALKELKEGGAIEVIARSHLHPVRYRLCLEADGLAPKKATPLPERTRPRPVPRAVPRTVEATAEGPTAEAPEFADPPSANFVTPLGKFGSPPRQILSKPSADPADNSEEIHSRNQKESDSAGASPATAAPSPPREPMLPGFITLVTERKRPTEHPHPKGHRIRQKGRWVVLIEPQFFCHWWAAYPNGDGGRKAGLDAYMDQLEAGATEEELARGLQAYTFPENPRFVPKAQNWLNDGCWQIRETVTPLVQQPSINPITGQQRWAS